MIAIEEDLKEFPLVTLAAGELLLTQGGKTDCIYFMVQGSVKIMKDDYEVAIVSDEGAVFGELSILLEKEHSASVECLEDSKFYCIENPGEYLEDHPKVIWHIAQILGLRIFNLNQYLVDQKTNDKGEDHLQMVEDVLGVLLNQTKTF
jgi:CRP/FNR family cyclic AMP-dependent transcriptional regulator